MDAGRHRWLWALVGTTVVIAGVFVVWLWQKDPEPAPQTGNDPQQSQNQQPPLQVALNDEWAGQTVSGTIDIALTEDDLSRVAHAEYFVDGTFAAVTYAYPFTFALDTTTLSAGEHTITAKAYDKAGKSFNVAPITITVAAQQPTTESSGGSASTPTKGRPRTSSTPSSTVSSGGDDTSSDDGNQTPGDMTAPSAPANLSLSADDGYTASIDWDASTDNVGVSGYQVYRNGAALGSVLGASTTDYKDQTVVPGNTYEYSVKALDAANNYSAFSTEPEISLVPTSIWIAADSPSNSDSSTDPYELGVKFRPLVNGKITGVKFYKATGSTGTHVGSLWSIGGSPMANVTFTGETASGWQQATFDEPIDVTAGTTYVVSYSVPNGRYTYNNGYFATEGITSQYLTALASGVAGTNGVYNATPGQFPTSSSADSNYWVDALFIPNENAGGPSVKTLDNSSVYPGFPGSNNTGVPVGKRLPTRDRGVQIYEDGAIMENIEVTGQVDIRADNILIRNSKINAFVYLDTDAPGASGWEFTVRDTEIDNGANQRGGVSLGNFTLERVNIHGGQMSTLCGANCTVSDSWLHGQYLPEDEDWHLGGFLSNGGSDMTVSGNTIACDTPNNLVGGGCSGDLNLFGDFAPIENILIDGNLFLASPGATYCVNLGYNAFKTYGPDAQNIDVTNNIFQRGDSGNCAGIAVGTDYMIAGTPAPGNSWINNKWDDGTTIAPPL